MDLNFFGDVTWYGGWGISIGSGAAGPGKAQASTVASKKIFDILNESGEFSIEAWVVPANVAQEMRRIVSYSSGPDLAQTSRCSKLSITTTSCCALMRKMQTANPVTSLNGDPQLSTRRTPTRSCSPRCSTSSPPTTRSTAVASTSMACWQRRPTRSRAARSARGKTTWRSSSATRRRATPFGKARSDSRPFTARALNEEQINQNFEGRRR